MQLENTLHNSGKTPLYPLFKTKEVISTIYSSSSNIAQSCEKLDKEALSNSQTTTNIPGKVFYPFQNDLISQYFENRGMDFRNSPFRK